MAKSDHQKAKLLHLVRIFCEKTSEEHPMTMKQILDELVAEGISCNRKTFYDDIKCLNEFGFHIEKKRKTAFATITMIADCCRFRSLCFLRTASSRRRF
jgi:hypothetical protein